MRKGHKRLLMAVVMVVLLLVVLYAGALVKAQARLRRAYAALEADGGPMQASEVIPGPIPDEENAGPLFVAAARPLKEQAVGLRDLLGRLEDFSIKYVEGNIDPEDLTLLQDYLGQEVLQDSLELFEEGLQYAGCRFDRHYDRGLWGDLNEARDMRSLLRIWRAKIRLEAGDAYAEGAWDRVLMQFRLAQALRDDPVLWSQITRHSMASKGCRTIQKLCSTNPPDEKTYQHLQQTLLAMDDVTPMLCALDGERLLRGERLFNLPMGDLYETLLEEEFMYGIRGFSSRVLFAYVKFKPRLVADHATYLEVMHRGAQILQEPFNPDARDEFRDLSAKSMLTREFVPWVDYGKRRFCGMAVHARITRAGLTALKYKQEHGAYPATLDMLGLERLSDPFSGEPLRYYAEGEAFSIYSVGENQQDNQGKPRDRKHKEWDDIAWHFPPLSERTDAGDPNEL